MYKKNICFFFLLKPNIFLFVCLMCNEQVMRSKNPHEMCKQFDVIARD